MRLSTMSTPAPMVLHAPGHFADNLDYRIYPDVDLIHIDLLISSGVCILGGKSLLFHCWPAR